MANPITTQFIKEIMADFIANKPSMVVGTETTKSGKIVGKTINIVTSIPLDLHKKEDNETRLKMQAVHQALMEKIGVGDAHMKQAMLNHLTGETTFAYETNSALTGRQIQDDLNEAMEKFTQMTPTELAKFTARVNALYDETIKNIRKADESDQKNAVPHPQKKTDKSMQRG